MEELLYPLETSWIVLLVAGALALFLLLEQGRSLPAQNIVLIAIILLVAEGFLEIPMAKYSKVAVTDPGGFFWPGPRCFGWRLFFPPGDWGNSSCARGGGTDSMGFGSSP